MVAQTIVCESETVFLHFDLVKEGASSLIHFLVAPLAAPENDGHMNEWNLETYQRNCDAGSIPSAAQL